MSLQVDFKVIQTPDCGTVKVEDNTPDYDAINAPFGYGAPNPARSAINATIFTWTLPDGTTKEVNKNYLPDPSGTQQDFVPADAGLTSFTDACYKIKYEVFSGDITSGSITAGTKYIVLDPSSTGAAVTYNGTQYTEGQTFTGVTGVTTYTEGDASLVVSEEISFVEHNVFYWCNLRTTIKNLMLAATKEKCQKGCEWIDELVRIDMELNSAMIAFEEGATECACDALPALAKEAVEFFNKCCC